MKKILSAGIVCIALWSFGAPALMAAPNFDTTSSPFDVNGLPVGGASLGQTAATPQASQSRGISCGNLTVGGLGGVSNCIISILDNIVILLMAAAVVVIVWGAFQMIYSEEKRKSGRETVVYGIIGLFVMVSIWGLVNILTNTFNLRGSYIAPPPLHSN